jgi:hypothetical protein
LKIGVDGVFTVKEEVLFQWETGVYRFFTRPIFAMSFSFNKYLKGRLKGGDVGVDEAHGLFCFPRLHTNVVE